jgi:hypothetical protein
MGGELGVGCGKLGTEAKGRNGRVKRSLGVREKGHW